MTIRRSKNVHSLSLRRSFGNRSVAVALILVSTLTTLITTTVTAQTTSKPQKVCAPDCGPFGICLPCSETDNCVGERCRCDDNYAGDDCSLQVDFCPQSVDVAGSVSTCLNGGRCVAKEIMENSIGIAEEVWRCDCRYAVGAAAAYAGIQCEFPSTQSCLLGGASSDYAFCVNGGDCVTGIIDGEPHPGCNNCPGFEGRHCQYVKGTAPPEELEAARNSQIEKSNGMRPGFIVLIVLLGGITLGLLALFAFRIQDASNSTTDIPTDLQLQEESHKEGISGEGTSETAEGNHSRDDNGEKDSTKPEVV